MNEFDVGEIIRRNQVTSEPSWLYAVHALNAALASGMSVQDAADAMDVELERFLDPPLDPADDFELRDAVLETLCEYAARLDFYGCLAVRKETGVRKVAHGLDSRTRDISMFEEGEARGFYLSGMTNMIEGGE